METDVQDKNGNETIAKLLSLVQIIFVMAGLLFG